VDDTVDVRVLLEDIVEILLICDVDLIIVRLLAADELYSVQGFWRRVVEVVDNDNLVAGVQQRKDRKGANVASAAVSRSAVND
jgi:hypothetical protein